MPRTKAAHSMRPNLRLTSELARLADLVGRGELAVASETVRDMERQWPHDEEVRRYARILAPPVVSVRKGKPARSRDQEYRWLREHSREHPGCWLAILGDRLVAANPDVKVVVEAVRRDPEARGALLHFEPEV